MRSRSSGAENERHAPVAAGQDASFGGEGRRSQRGLEGERLGGSIRQCGRGCGSDQHGFRCGGYRHEGDVVCDASGRNGDGGFGAGPPPVRSGAGQRARGGASCERGPDASQPDVDPRFQSSRGSADPHRRALRCPCERHGDARPPFRIGFGAGVARDVPALHPQDPARGPSRRPAGPRSLAHRQGAERARPGDAPSALRAIAAASALPSRQLVPEELAVEAQALRSLGRNAEAKSVAELLRARYPESALAR